MRAKRARVGRPDLDGRVGRTAGDPAAVGAVAHLGHAFLVPSQRHVPRVVQLSRPRLLLRVNEASILQLFRRCLKGIFRVAAAFVFVGVSEGAGVVAAAGGVVVVLVCIGRSIERTVVVVGWRVSTHIQSTMFGRGGLDGLLRSVFVAHRKVVDGELR